MTIRNPNDGSTYVVKYMNIMGRAGVIRVILHLGGAEYKNEFIQMESVKDHRGDYPFGQVPVLVETKPDGTRFELGESLAIQHYLAEKFGLLGSNPQEAALYKSIGFNIYFELYNHCFASRIPIQEAIADPTSEFRTKALPQFLQCHEGWLRKNGDNGYYFGNSLTYPDLVLLNWVRLMASLGYQIDKESPIKKLEDTLKELPEWNGKYDDFSPVSTFNVE
ncbi:hypothetical protein B0O80DRAFT_428676 [Mortierella sp. GBAus27b]|nr:hypothetical protein BGX31_007709 [Mortierella sp. GBA43]KAI8350006.1 hypothetical protein B0O80DRAFT_428676 [Mortierella sp. GBAus27b]